MKRHLHESELHPSQPSKRQNNQGYGTQQQINQSKLPPGSDELSANETQAESAISKLVQVAQNKLQNSATPTNVEGKITSHSIIESTSKRPGLPVQDQKKTLSALDAIKTTLFEHSFLSRLQGSKAAPQNDGALYVDWDTETPWMQLMDDIRTHYVLLHEQPDDPPPVESSAPLTYTTLKRAHLVQVHDLLERVFWSGIDVSDSLDYSPERATVIAMYKKLVVGVAILSSPKETYITFLAVRAGWDKAQIAKTMLYLLVSRNPDSDITLHVSVNNSAMLLYNQFGFKAEEFVAGFYEDYLDPQSRASKNAFKLRLRR